MDKWINIDNMTLLNVKYVVHFNVQATAVYAEDTNGETIFILERGSSNEAMEVVRTIMNFVLDEKRMHLYLADMIHEDEE